MYLNLLTENIHTNMQLTVLIYPNIYNLINQQLAIDLVTAKYVTRLTAMRPPLLILIIVCRYPDYGMHYQS